MIPRTQRPTHQDDKGHPLRIIGPVDENRTRVEHPDGYDQRVLPNARIHRIDRKR